MTETTGRADAPTGTTGFAPDVRARIDADVEQIMARYPQPRSALLPMLHLLQSEEGYVSSRGIEYCAEKLGLSTAEVSGVVTFYTMYKRRPNGEYNVGVCTNTLCAIMGGDQIFATLKDHLGVGHDETTEDGKVTLEHLECNAACDFAPVMMVNWEFYDNQTPESAVELVDSLRTDNPVQPTRGATLCSFREVSRVLAGFPDGRADEGPAAGPATLAGLQIYREQQNAGKRRRGEDTDGAANGRAGADRAASAETPASPASGTGYGPAGGPSGSDEPAETAESDPANAAETGTPDAEREGEQ